MPEVNINIQALLDKRTKGEQLTTEETSELDAWINVSDHNRQLLADLMNKKQLLQDYLVYHTIDVEASYNEFQEKYAIKRAGIYQRLKPYLNYAAVLVLLAGLFFGLNYLMHQSNSSDTKKPARQQPVASTPGLSTPENVSIILALSDGSIINLDSVAEEKSFSDGYSAFMANNTAIKYPVLSNRPVTAEEKLNTLYTPRKIIYQLILSDGTHVWLNAASSLSYPTLFNTHERKVELTGEAFFDVAKDTKRPFKVLLSKSSGNNAIVEALGTRFNISAYANDTIKTTLLDGSITMIRNNDTAHLRPGMEAILPTGATDSITVFTNSYAGEIALHKDGIYMLHDVLLTTIMKQIERLYYAKIKFKGVDRELRFEAATIDTNQSLDEFLKILENTGEIYFETGKDSIITVKSGRRPTK